MNEHSTEKGQFTARKCSKEDFKGLEALWLDYEDRQVHLICPDVDDEDIVLFADKTSRKLQSYSLRITKCSKGCARDIDEFFQNNLFVTNIIHQKVDMLYHNADLLDPHNLPVVRQSMQTGRFILQDQKFIQSYVDLRPNYLLLEDDLF